MPWRCLRKQGSIKLGRGGCFQYKACVPTLEVQLHAVRSGKKFVELVRLVGEKRVRGGVFGIV